MPIIKSAKKRVRVAKKATIRNAKTKRRVREAVKAFQAAISKGKQEEITKAQNAANSAIDSAAKKNVIHKNKAARKKSQISAAVKKSGIKSTDKKVVKKTTVKKTAVKKAPVKKTASKKAPAKKPAVKKAK